MEERMKRTMILIALIVMGVAVPVTFAQQSSTAAASGNGLDTSGDLRMTSDLYPVRVDVARVYSHSQGYKIVYRKGQASFAELYAPTTWFVPGGKAILVRGHGPQYPYLVVYYKADGTFSHLKLFVLENMKDSSWGTIEGDPGDRFKVESVKLEF
jgi:hypothetical protein